MLCFKSFSQKIDSLHILRSTDWKTQKTWFGSEYIVLKPIPKFDHSKLEHLNTQEQSRAMAKFHQGTRGEGERISFYKNQEMKYTYSLRCGVGERIYNLKKFHLLHAKVYTEYEITSWKGDIEKKGKATYKVMQWSQDSITLEILKN